ncbi:MAG: hypothetical protein ACRDPT_14180 [Streptomycetales bacterium]
MQPDIHIALGVARLARALDDACRCGSAVSARCSASSRLHDQMPPVTALLCYARSLRP